ASEAIAMAASETRPRVSDPRGVAGERGLRVAHRIGRPGWRRTAERRADADEVAWAEDVAQPRRVDVDGGAGDPRRHVDQVLAQGPLRCGAVRFDEAGGDRGRLHERQAVLAG